MARTTLAGAAITGMALALSTGLVLAPASAAANTWTYAAPLPTARTSLAAASGSDGLVYAIGGTAAYSQDLATVEAYDPATHMRVTRRRRWQPLPSCVPPWLQRGHPTACST